MIILWWSRSDGDGDGDGDGADDDDDDDDDDNDENHHQHRQSYQTGCGLCLSNLEGFCFPMLAITCPTKSKWWEFQLWPFGPIPGEILGGLTSY